jgi:hypothetical protein
MNSRVRQSSQCVLVFLKSEKTFDNFMLFHPRIRPQSVTLVLAGYDDFQVGHGWYPAFLLLIASRLVGSGPLSQRIAKGCPRSATIASSTRVTLRLAKLVSTSKAKKP